MPLEKKKEADALAVAREAFEKLNAIVTTVSKADLPILDASTAGKDDLPVLARMYYWAKASSMGDSFLPFSFTELGSTADVALLLVGKTVWQAMFKGAVITSEDICPMQLRQIMFFQLMAFDTILKADQALAAQEAEAQKAWDTAEPRLKRLRMSLRN